MKSKKEGSALLIVLIISMGLLSTLMALWRCTMLMDDITVSRERSYQRFYSGQAFLCLGIALCHYHYQACAAMATFQEQIALETSAWPLTPKKCVTARLLLIKQGDNGLRLTAYLLDGNKSLYSASCLVYQNYNQPSYLSNSIHPTQRHE